MGHKIVGLLYLLRLRPVEVEVNRYSVVAMQPSQKHVTFDEIPR